MNDALSVECGHCRRACYFVGELLDESTRQPRCDRLNEILDSGDLDDDAEAFCNGVFTDDIDDDN